jgi:hypothetical protein
VSTVGSVETIAAEARRAFAEQRYAQAAAGFEQCIALAPQSPAEQP